MAFQGVDEITFSFEYVEMECANTHSGLSMLVILNMKLGSLNMKWDEEVFNWSEKEEMTEFIDYIVK